MQWWRHKKTKREVFVKMVTPGFRGYGYIEFQYDDTGRNCTWFLDNFEKQFEFVKEDV